MLGFAGHGVQMKLIEEGKPVFDNRNQPLSDAYFCPVDAVFGDGATMISLTRLLEQLDGQGGINLLLVDACRDTPRDPNRGGPVALGERAGGPDPGQLGDPVQLLGGPAGAGDRQGRRRSRGLLLPRDRGPARRGRRPRDRRGHLGRPGRASSARTSTAAPANGSPKCAAGRQAHPGPAPDAPRAEQPRRHAGPIPRCLRRRLRRVDRHQDRADPGRRILDGDVARAGGTDLAPLP